MHLGAERAINFTDYELIAENVKRSSRFIEEYGLQFLNYKMIDGAKISRISMLYNRNILQ